MNQHKKHIPAAAVLLLAFCGLFSCSKTSTPPGTAALTIVNAVVGSHNLVTNFSGNGGSKTSDVLTYYKSALQIGYGGYSELSSYSGMVPLSLSPITDTSLSLWSGTLNLPINSINSLFLTGTDTLHIETLITTDNPPYHPATDSTMSVRFVNLSPGSGPVNVTLSTSTGVNEFDNIAYKGITAFKNYPAIASVSSYSFQFWDAGTNALLASYTMNGVNNGSGSNTANNSWRYRNFTIMLKGLPGAQSASLINNY